MMMRKAGMLKIKNRDTLAVSEARKAALDIAEAGLQAIDTKIRIKKEVLLDAENLKIRDYAFDLKNIRKLLVIGIGKCSTEAAEALEEILGERISGGAIIDVKKDVFLKKITAHLGTHPLPSSANVQAAASIVKLLQGLTQNDLVIFVISGGGSTFLCLPDRQAGLPADLPVRSTQTGASAQAGLPQDRGCDDEAAILQTLMKAGAAIQEINTVRKHLSLARGGYLAEYAYPAQVVSLIFSDVPDNDIQYIASGPTVKDETTIADAEQVLRKYDVLNKCGIGKCGLVETPKHDKYFEKVRNIVIVSNEIALAAMAEKAKESGFNPQIRNSSLAGEASLVAEEIVRELHKAGPKTALVYAGETTVTVKGKGKGGRNLELALSALRFIQEGELVLALASDGRDNSDVAGAVCDKITKEKAESQNLNPGEYLSENNSYAFFQATGDFLLTGDTGTNVSDLIIALKL